MKIAWNKIVSVLLVVFGISILGMTDGVSWTGRHYYDAPVILGVEVPQNVSLATVLCSFSVALVLFFTDFGKDNRRVN